MTGLSKQTINQIKFVEAFEKFRREVEQDITKGVTHLNIDYYMRDLRKHALKEYGDVYEIEQGLFKNTNSTECAEMSNKDMLKYNDKLNERYGLRTLLQIDSVLTETINKSSVELFDFSLLDSKEKKKLKKKQRKKDKKIKL